MSNSFSELPTNNFTPDSNKEKFVGLDYFSKPLTEKQMLSNPYVTVPLNKIEGVGRYLNSSTYNKLGFSFDPNLENKYYQETPWYKQLGNATAQLFGQAAAGFDAQMSKLEQIKQTFGTTSDDYLEDTFKASEDLRERYPIFKSSNETYGILGYTPFGEDVFSKWTNFIPNLGFTFGTMAGVFLENAVATAIIETTTGGLGTPLAASKWVKDLYSGVKSIKSFSDIKKLANVANIGKNIYSAEKVLGSAGNIVRGAEALKAGKSLNGALHSIYGGYQLYSAAAGEALIENANSVGEVMKEFKSDFIEKNGRDPNGEELKKMQESAEGLVLPSSLGNIGVLMASNGLQELNAFKIGKSLSTIAVTGSSKIAQEVSKKVVLDKSNGLYREALANEIRNSTIKSIGRSALGVLSEGAEESAQGVVAEATKNYFKAKYYDKPITWTEALGQGFAYASSDQGMEEFYAGVVTGGLFTGGGKALNQYQYRKDQKKSFEKTGKTVGQLAQDEIKSLNEEVIPILKYNMAASQSSENVKVQTVIQQQMMDAYKRGDIIQAESLKEMSLFKAMFTAKTYGKDEELLKHYENLNKLDRSDLAKYLNVEESDLMSQEDFQKSLNTLKEAGEAIDLVVKKFTNPYKKPNIADKQYENLSEEARTEAYLYQTALFESYQAAQELLAGQYLLNKKSSEKYNSIKSNLEAANVPMDLLSAVLSRSDRNSRFYLQLQSLSNEESDLLEELSKTKSKKKRKQLEKQIEETRKDFSDISSKIESKIEKDKEGSKAQVNYIKELKKKYRSLKLTFDLLDKENNPEAKKYKAEMDNLEREASIIENQVLSQEEKLKKINELRSEDSKFKFNRNALESNGISSIKDIIDAFNFLGTLKQDIDYSENVIDRLSDPSKMDFESSSMFDRILEARKRLYSNIVENNVEEDPIEEQKETTEEEVVNTEEKNESTAKEQKPTKIKPGTKVLYDDEEYVVESIEFVDGEAAVFKIKNEDGTIKVKDRNKLTIIEKTSEINKELEDLKNKEVSKEKTEKDKSTLKKEEPTSDIEAQKADIEKTLYGTISGSIPLSQALPNGTYIDLGNSLFAYADKGEKIAAIVDKDNNYLVSKSFWNSNTNKWQLPNLANLKDDAKRLGVDETTYIKTYQNAVDVLNTKYDTELDALESTNKKEKQNKQSTKDKLITNIKKLKEDLKNEKEVINYLKSSPEFKKIKKDFESWSKDLDTDDLQLEIETLNLPWEDTKESENKVKKYLVIRYIDTQLKMMGESSLSPEEEEEVIKAEPGNTGNITLTDTIETVEEITKDDEDSTLMSIEEYKQKLINKIIDNLEKTGTLKLNKEEQEFYNTHREEIDSFVNISLNKEEKETEKEEEKETFLEVFNKLLLLSSTKISDKKEAIYNILDRIKFSISDSWFKFKYKEISMNLKQTLDKLVKEYKNVEFTNLSKSYVDKEGNKQVKLYTHRLLNKNIKEDYDNFKLFRNQYSLHLDITEENTEEVMDKLMRFVNDNNIYMIIGSAYNIARPDNIRIYSSKNLDTRILGDLITDLSNSKLSNPVINDYTYDLLPTTEKLRGFIDSIPEDVKENVLNYLGFNSKNREFITKDVDYKNGLSINSLQAAKLFVKAYDNYLVNGNINLKEIIEPIINQQLRKAAFYGEVKSIFEELLNNPAFDEIRNKAFYKNLIALANAKMSTLKVFNFSNTTLSIGDTLYNKNNEEFEIIDNTLLSKEVEDINKKTGQIKVLKILNKITKVEQLVTQFEYKQEYSKYPFKQTGSLEALLNEKQKQEEEEKNLLPDTLFTTITNDNDIFFNADGTPKEEVDINSSIGRLVVQRLESETDVKVKIETPDYDNPNSDFYIEEGKENNNVPKRIQELIIERRKVDPKNKDYGKILTVVDKRGNYIKYDNNGYPSENGLIPLFFIPKGTLSVSGDTVSYGGRTLRSLSEMVKGKSEEEIEEAKKQIIERIQKEAEQLDRLHNLKTPEFLNVDFISNGISDTKDIITYNQVKKLKGLKFSMSNIEKQKGIVTMSVNNTEIKLKQKAIGQEMALSILAYLGIEDGYFLTKGYSIGKKIKQSYKALDKELKESFEREDRLYSYNIRNKYLNFLNRSIYMGQKNFEVLFDTFFMHDETQEVFDAISIRDYNTDKSEPSGIPNVFTFGDTWKRLNNNKNNDDYYSYLDTIVELMSKMVFDTNPDFVSSEVNTNFVTIQDTLDIAEVNVPEYLMEKYTVNGILVNESLLSSKNRYMKFQLTTTPTIKQKTKEEETIEDFLSLMDEAEKESEKLNLKPLSRANKTSSSVKTLPADQKYKDSVISSIRHSLGNIGVSLKKVESDKMKKDIANANTMLEVDNVRNKILEKYNCNI